MRLQTFEPAGPVGTGIWEAVTGPVATNTYAKEIDGASGKRGTGDFVTSLFLKPPPPRGIGMLCAATDVDSYAEVRVTRDDPHGDAEDRRRGARPREDRRRLRAARASGTRRIGAGRRPARFLFSARWSA